MNENKVISKRLCRGRFLPYTVNFCSFAEIKLFSTPYIADIATYVIVHKHCDDANNYYVLTVFLNIFVLHLIYNAFNYLMKIGWL